MSEQLTMLFEQLRGSQPPTPFAPAEQVRRRGRQRNHRQALAAGSAVLTVAGLATGWAVGTTVSPVPSASPTPKPSVSPTWPPPPPTSPPQPVYPPRSTSRTPTSDPPSVPPSRLLKPEDFAAIGNASSAELEDQGPDGPDWPWLTVLSECPAYQRQDYPTLAERTGARGLMYSSPGGDDWYAWEIVESYPDAAANLADVRQAIARCPVHQVPDGVEIQLTVVAEHFAGDDALLVEVRRGASIDYTVAVRVGNLVATLMYATGPEADAKDMAAAMVARLD